MHLAGGPGSRAAKRTTLGNALLFLSISLAAGDLSILYQILFFFLFYDVLKTITQRRNLEIF